MAIRMKLREQTVTQIKQSGGEAWAIQTDGTGECRIQRPLLVQLRSTCFAWLPFDFRLVHF